MECHMLVGCILKDKSIQGYLDKDLVDPQRLKQRHSELVQEMYIRGYRHKSPLPAFSTTLRGHLDIESNIEELKRRCPECRKRILEFRA